MSGTLKPYFVRVRVSVSLSVEDWSDSHHIYDNYKKQNFITNKRG